MFRVQFDQNFDKSPKETDLLPNQFKWLTSKNNQSNFFIIYVKLIYCIVF